MMRSSEYSLKKPSKLPLLGSFKESASSRPALTERESSEHGTIGQKSSNRSQVKMYSSQVSKIINPRHVGNSTTLAARSLRDDGALRSTRSTTRSRDIMARRYEEGNRLMQAGKLEVKKISFFEPIETEEDRKNAIEKERAERLKEFKLKKDACNYLRKNKSHKKHNIKEKLSKNADLRAISQAIDENIGQLEKCQERGTSYQTYYSSFGLIRRCQVDS